MPNFFIKVKGPDNNKAITKLHTCYNSIISIYNIYEFRLFGTKDFYTKYDNKIYNFTLTYYNNNFKFYITYSILSRDPEVSYKYYIT